MTAYLFLAILLTIFPIFLTANVNSQEIRHEFPGINQGIPKLGREKRNLPQDSLPVNFKKSTKFELTKKSDLPINFDASVKWPECAKSIKTIRNQGDCPSCWASVTASVISDVTCIKCNGQYSPYLSEQDFLSCCLNCGDCYSGGDVIDAFEYWIREGIVTEECLPYLWSPNTARCPNDCQPSYNYTYTGDKHKGDNYTIIHGEINMQLAIYEHGPIVVKNFEVYEDFRKNYKNGIYIRNSSLISGSRPHSVKVYGWGEADGVPYWLAANSWGTVWGHKGFFTIIRGTNESNIEAIAIQAIADPSSCF